jgi:hypothetical protein
VPLPRFEVCARNAAGVASVMNASETTPVALPRNRVRNCERLSMRGLSLSSGVLSGKTPSIPLFVLLPVE